MSEQRKVGRRRFFGGLGAGGLAVAGAVFGRATPAEALIAVGCCNLCWDPSGTLSQCQSGTHYTWSCSITGGNHVVCTCCEHGATQDICRDVTSSWAGCQTVG